jgi:hypothetical protein
MLLLHSAAKGMYVMVLDLAMVMTRTKPTNKGGLDQRCL